MARLGFKGPHTEETKDRISQSMKGRRPGGFNVRVDCKYCKKDVAKPNLKRHEKSCERLHDCLHIFPKGISLRKLKHMNNCLRGNYKIDIYEYVRLYELQNGKCKICSKTSENETLHVDHCHATSKVRGLLCRHCNLILGKWLDNIEIFESAIKYLKENL